MTTPIPIAPGATFAAARRTLTAAFHAAGLETPELDARVLVGHALGLDHSGLASNNGRALGAGEARAVKELAARRLAREPVARIVGYKEFWGLELQVTPATLVPRPETETVVEAALALLDAAGKRSRTLHIADLGTGTGALLLALLTELPAARGVGTDISRKALAVARDNAMRLGLAARADFVACNFGAALKGGFDLVVSNPPYVASAEIAALAPEVAADPRSALDGGVDGLACYRALAAGVQRLLAPAGHLVVELGDGQEGMVTAIMRRHGLATMRARADIAGVPRALGAHFVAVAP